MASLNSNTRVTAAEVSEIFDTNLTEEQLHNWINMAAETTDDVEAAGSLSSTRLKLIEQNLAAHYAATQDPRVSSETVGDVKADYKGSDETTDYWQTAVQLDTTDTLSRDQSATASVDILDSRGLE